MSVLVRRADGTAIKIDIKDGVGLVWMYDKDGKCIREPLSERIARSKYRNPQPEQSEEEIPTTKDQEV